MLKNVKITIKLPLLFLAIGIIPAIIAITYSYQYIKRPYVKEAVGGLMNFTDAKQHGVIRFLDQNRKMAIQLSRVATYMQPEQLSTYFKEIVETDVFDAEKHPFAHEIKSGKRKIPTFRTYHYIDYAKGGTIVASSDSSRIGKASKEVAMPKWGYSDPYFEDSRYIVTFGKKANDGLVQIHADGKMLTNIIGGEIGNLADGIGAFYLAGVGKTMDYYIVNKDNVMITESRVYQNSLLKQKGSEEPWERTLKGQFDPQCANGVYATNAGAVTGCREAMGFYKGPSGNTMLGASMPFYDSEWTVVVEQENWEILSPFYKTRNRLIGFSIWMGLFIGATALYLNRRITNPVEQTISMLRDIADGRGDLTKRLRVASGDELGMLSMYFNKFTESLQDMVRDIFATSKEVTSSTIGIRRSSETMHKSIQGQLQKIEENANSIDEMDTSMKVIAHTTENLITSADTAAVSVQEMTASIAEVSANTEKLSSSVETSSSAIMGMVSSIKEVASHTEILSTQAEEIASSIMQINSTVKEVEGLAKNQANLAVKVRGDATGLGMDAVKKTMEGMEKIKDDVSDTATVIHAFGSRSKEIGKILNVINEIADAINLLALNASILAAQAGEHGKGFAVVANEIKGLAGRTAESTKEIANLITAVQSEAKKAVDSMERSLTRVDDGVRLSKDAHETLGKISDSSNMSVDMAKRIENATIEQSRSASLVADSIQKMNNMVKEIKEATAEQLKSSEDIVVATEGMRYITRGLNRSTDEQARESKNINQMVIEVTDKMKTIARAISEQMAAAEIIAKNTESIKTEAKENTLLSRELDKMTKGLDQMTLALKERMERFKI